MTKRGFFTLSILIFFLFSFTACPKPDPFDGDGNGNGDVTISRTPMFTFESDTDIEDWLSQDAVYDYGENGATGGSLAVSTDQVKHGSRSLKVMGALGTGSYPSHEARFKLYETKQLPAQDFSDIVVTVYVYTPSPPEGGGDYIQVVLHNAANDNVQSKAFSCTFDAWNTIVFDISAYISGGEAWGYDTTEGSPQTVYTAVTQVGVKVGFATGPDRSFYYYIDDLDWGDGSLGFLGAKKGIYIGAAVNPSLFGETEYDETLHNEFTMMVAENVMKMDALQPTEGYFNYGPADAILDYAEEKDMAVRGHCLLWHNQVPAWAKAKTYSDLLGVLRNHIDNVLTHYKGNIHSWDVVNEVIKDDGSGLRNNDDGSSIWADSSADDSLIKEAFYKAHAVDPDALLIINDYSNETMGSTKADALYALVADWVGEGVPIHGVGFQLHLVEDYNPDYTGIRNNIQRYVNLGLEVHFTEIDVRIYEPVTQAKYDHQADIYAGIMQIALDYPEVTVFVTWGVTDKYSWIPTFFEGYEAALLFNDVYEPKPAYDALIDILRQ